MAHDTAEVVVANTSYAIAVTYSGDEVVVQKSSLRGRKDRRDEELPLYYTLAPSTVLDLDYRTNEDRIDPVAPYRADRAVITARPFVRSASGKLSRVDDSYVIIADELTICLPQCVYDREVRGIFSTSSATMDVKYVPNHSSQKFDYIAVSVDRHRSGIYVKKRALSPLVFRRQTTDTQSPPGSSKPAAENGPFPEQRPRPASVDQGYKTSEGPAGSNMPATTSDVSVEPYRGAGFTAQSQPDAVPASGQEGNPVDVAPASQTTSFVPNSSTPVYHFIPTSSAIDSSSMHSSEETLVRPQLNRPLSETLSRMHSADGCSIDGTGPGSTRPGAYSVQSPGHTPAYSLGNHVYTKDALLQLNASPLPAKEPKPQKVYTQPSPRATDPASLSRFYDAPPPPDRSTIDQLENALCGLPAPAAGEATGRFSNLPAGGLANYVSDDSIGRTIVSQPISVEYVPTGHSYSMTGHVADQYVGSTNSVAHATGIHAQFQQPHQYNEYSHSRGENVYGLGVGLQKKAGNYGIGAVIQGQNAYDTDASDLSYSSDYYTSNYMPEYGSQHLATGYVFGAQTDGDISNDTVYYDALTGSRPNSAQPQPPDPSQFSRQGVGAVPPAGTPLTASSVGLRPSMGRGRRLEGFGSASRLTGFRPASPVRPSVNPRFGAGIGVRLPTSQVTGNSRFRVPLTHSPSPSPAGSIRQLHTVGMSNPMMSVPPGAAGPGARPAIAVTVRNDNPIGLIIVCEDLPPDLQTASNMGRKWSDILNIRDNPIRAEDLIFGC